MAPSGLVQKKLSAQNQFANPAEIIKFQSFLTLLTTLLVNFDKEPGDIMVLEYCHEPNEGQGTPFEAFGTSLYFKKVFAQKVPSREIRGRLLFLDSQISIIYLCGAFFIDAK